MQFLETNLKSFFYLSRDEVREISEKMLGQQLVTKQSGSEGKICLSVMVAERKFARREFYFGFAMDREHNGPVLIASRFRCVDIEKVAAENHEAIIVEPIDQEKGMTCELAEWITRRVGIIDQSTPTVKMLCNLYNLFIQKDALLVEINPYIEDVCLNYFALDAMMRFDDSSKFRQPEIFSKRDETQEDPKEVAAQKVNMNYISLDGNIGCVVNGAGLAMATCDILKFHNGCPANFLDVGSMATAEEIKEAIKVVMMDEKVRTIFVNIFGGIMRCDYIVEGLMKAIKECDIKIPIVIRLQGNMKAEGQKLVRETNMNIIEREDFAEAADAAVKCSIIMHLADCNDLEAALKMKVKAEFTPVTTTKPKFPPCPNHKKDPKNDDMTGGVVNIPKKIP